jgi:hypothetical protein
VVTTLSGETGIKVRAGVTMPSTSTASVPITLPTGEEANAEQVAVKTTPRLNTVAARENLKKKRSFPTGPLFSLNVCWPDTAPSHVRYEFILLQ